MNLDEQIKKLNEKLNESRPVLRGLDQYYAGEQPAAFMSEKSREALGNRLQRMAVNIPRVTVTSLQERLELTGFRLDGAAEADEGLWRLWRRNRMRDGSAQAHLDALVYGRSYAVVWADAQGNPVVTVESPLQVATLADPVSRRVTVAFKRWTDVDGMTRGVLYGPEEIWHLSAGRVVDEEQFPTTGWTITATVPNPLGVVPVVPIVNRGRLLDLDGVSEMRDVLGLTDALNKVLADSLVTSEYYARPRRWATGLEIMEDEEGQPINPFSDKGDRIMMSESPETKFGQFDGARLDGYGDLVGTLVQQVSAVTGLPAHVLGIHGDQPASADAIRSAESSLVARAQELMRTFGDAWAEVACLVIAVRDGVDPLTVDVEPLWANPETRTPAQAADAAAKLHGIGVPLEIVLADTLGYTPAQVARATGTTAQKETQNV